MKRSKRNRGFSLIELMVVVVMISVVLGMALPMLIKSRIAANEGSAVASLRILNSANAVYQSQHGFYAPDLATLQDEGLIDPVLASGVRAGYDFSSYSSGPATWSVQADPVSPGRSGDRGFYLNESGVIRFSSSAGAGELDPAIR